MLGSVCVYFAVMLAIIWRIGDIAKNNQRLLFFMICDGSQGRIWYHFRMFLGCLLQDRFLILLGSFLGSILETFGLPNGVKVVGVRGYFFGFIFAWFMGWSLGVQGEPGAE